MKITEAKVIITGAAGGIGSFLCDSMLLDGASVIAVDINTESLDRLQAHSRLFKYQCDLSQSGDVEILMGKIFEDHADTNVLINNAGFIHSEPLFNLLRRDSPKHDTGAWLKTIDLNLNSLFYTSVNFVDCIYSKRTKNAVIINMSSISANGNAGQSAYSAAKAAVEALTVTWSKELGMLKMRCAAIAPGFIATPSTYTALSESTLQKWQQSVPLRRLGAVGEIYIAARFIIENDYYNGKILEVDGGLTI